MEPSLIKANKTVLKDNLHSPATHPIILVPEKVHKPDVQFAAALVHEVRNPLTNINLSIEMLESLTDNKELKVYMDIIIRSSKRINELVTGLLSQQMVSEVRAGKHSIHELLNDVINMADDRIKLKKIFVQKKFDPDCSIIMDRDKMKIGLTNIIVNAIEAMPSGRGKLKIMTRTIAGKYVIHIADNGCGISKSNLKNIFKAYNTNKVGGLGLGLATTCEILRANHVEVHIESTVGKGTCFSLAFDKNQILTIDGEE